MGNSMIPYDNLLLHLDFVLAPRVAIPSGLCLKGWKGMINTVLLHLRFVFPTWIWYLMFFTRSFSMSYFCFLCMCLVNRWRVPLCLLYRLSLHLDPRSLTYGWMVYGEWWSVGVAWCCMSVCVWHCVACVACVDPHRQVQHQHSKT